MKYMQFAQAHHTPGEELVYRTLWAAGKPAMDGRRISAVSYRDLALRTGLDTRTVQRVIRRLMEKRCIEVHKKAWLSRPTQYLVFPYSEINRRRTAARDVNGSVE
jgi:hypothetical protein